jgi:hypothetical protein
VSTASDNDQDLVAAVLASRPAPSAAVDFVSRVNARIDETAGWLGLADFRAWTLGLAPAAATVALIAFFWPATATPTSPATAQTTQTETFSPASDSDWQQDISADALLDAALHSPRGEARVR